MLIRKNTKEYKAINNIFRFHATKNKSIKEKNIQLYIVENGKTVADKISVATLPENKDVYYEMTYGTILESFGQPNYQLHRSEDNEHLYFFRNANNKGWDQTPFELSKSLHAKISEFIDIVIEPAKEKEAPAKATEAKKIAKPKPAKKGETIVSPKGREVAKEATLSNPPAASVKVEEIKKPIVDYTSKDWLKVGSAGIEAFKYIFDKKMLYIVYRPDSSCYVYYNVRKNDFLEILAQEHMATFVNQQFKVRHEYDFVGKVLV
ncbi:MAG TPA: KTSC domain-containing protein [Cytophagaceae bacterium]|jgi:hypothetical protein